MLSWVVTFLVIALIAGILGFGGIAGASIEIAKIIFFIAVVLFLVSAVIGLARGRTRVYPEAFDPPRNWRGERQRYGARIGLTKLGPWPGFTGVGSLPGAPPFYLSGRPGRPGRGDGFG